MSIHIFSDYIGILINIGLLLEFSVDMYFAVYFNEYIRQCFGINIILKVDF